LDLIGWNSIQQDKVSLKQETILGERGMFPWLWLKFCPRASGSGQKWKDIQSSFLQLSYIISKP
jgi:hypothetical protein